jgi:hypothetical protein
MRSNDLRQVVFTIRKINDGWHIALPDDTQIGPYLPNIALEVAMAHALLARKRDLDAQVFVRDECGGTHRCMVIDWMNDPNRCQKCESSWRTSALPVKCPLRAAFTSSPSS